MHASTHACPSLCTYNTRGLASNALESNKLRAAKAGNLQHLGGKFDGNVVCVQETKLAKDHLYLDKLFTNHHHINYSNHASNSAGVATIVNSYILPEKWKWELCKTNHDSLAVAML